MGQFNPFCLQKLRAAPAPMGSEGVLEVIAAAPEHQTSLTLREFEPRPRDQSE